MVLAPQSIQLFEGACPSAAVPSYVSSLVESAKTVVQPGDPIYSSANGGLLVHAGALGTGSVGGQNPVHTGGTGASTPLSTPVKLALAGGVAAAGVGALNASGALAERTRA